MSLSSKFRKSATAKAAKAKTAKAYTQGPVEVKVDGETCIVGLVDVPPYGVMLDVEHSRKGPKRMGTEWASIIAACYAQADKLWG